MANLERLSFTIEGSLLEKLERLLADGNYKNRSEFIRDMVRSKLVEEEWEKDEQALGTITLVYNHETRALSDRLTDLQHSHHDLVLATTHVHLDRHLCAEMIMMKGRAHEIRAMADRIRQQKGVLHAALSMSSTGKSLV